MFKTILKKRNLAILSFVLFVPFVLLTKQTHATAISPKGSLVIIGGGLKDTNVTVYERIIELAGGKGASIAIFPTASFMPEFTCKNLVALFTKYGGVPFCIPLSPQLSTEDYTKVAMNPTLAHTVRSAGGVFFSGGDQVRITQALYKNDGSNTLMLDALWDLYRRGGVIAGSSAGAAMMSSTMFYNSPKSVLNALKQGVHHGKEISVGLGFIGSDVFVDQHLIARGRFARMLPAMIKANYKLGLGIDENTAMVVTPNRNVEIIGDSGAILVDLKEATINNALTDFNLSNARISYLDNGDNYNIDTGAITPSLERIPNQLGVNVKKPDQHGTLFFSDILGRGHLTALMENLMDSEKSEARGIAFGGPDEPKPYLGFEFKFSKTPETITYVSKSGDAYSMYQIRLDVNPIDMPQKLYKYK
jgi:cyanophycinase